MTYRDNLIEAICNLFKDIHNCKPRHIDFGSMTTAELDEYYADLGVEHDAYMASEEDREAAVIKSFEAEIDDVIALGAGDRETAIRWIAQANGEERDAGFLCYLLGLPYSYEQNLKGVGALV